MKTVVLGFSLFGLLMVAAAADSDLPGNGFSGDRYAELWQKSPFAIATPEVASQDYDLVGLAEFEGISYVSLVDKQTQEHFVLTTEKSVRNLMLISVHHDAKGGSAVIARNGEQLVLQEQNPAPSLAALAAINSPPEELVPPPAFPLPRPPRSRFHRPLIVVPPRPANPY